MAGFWQRLKRLFRGSSARDGEPNSSLPLALESATKETNKPERERKVYESSGVVILEDNSIGDVQVEPVSSSSSSGADSTPAQEKPTETTSEGGAGETPKSADTDSAVPQEESSHASSDTENSSSQSQTESVSEPNRKIPVHGVKTADICAASADAIYGSPAIDRTPGRKLILAFEKRIPNQRCEVWYTRSSDHGISWEEPQVLFDQETYTDSGECFTSPQIIISQVTGRVFVAVTTRTAKDDSKNRIAVAFTDDEGDTWRYRDLTTLVDGDQNWVSRRTAYGHGLQVRNGVWTGRLAYVAIATDSDGRRGAVAVCSDDQGISWWAGKLAGETVVQATITELNDGSLVLGCVEETESGFTFNAYGSKDGGRSFTTQLEQKALGSALPAAVERAFYSAPEHTEQARVMLSVAHNQNGQGTVRSMLDYASELLGIVPFTSHPVNAIDIVSLEDVRIVAVAYETDSGISVSVLCIDTLSLKYLAVGWNAREEEQNQVLRRAGLLTR